MAVGLSTPRVCRLVALRHSLLIGWSVSHFSLSLSLSLCFWIGNGCACDTKRVLKYVAILFVGRGSVLLFVCYHVRVCVFLYVYVFAYIFMYICVCANGSLDAVSILCMTFPEPPVFSPTPLPLSPRVME